MGLLNKGRRNLEKKTDAASLNSAMDELTKQTEALLGSLNESPKNTKPMLPKRKAMPEARGKSFDIIHSPSRSTRLQGTLKTVEVKKQPGSISSDNEIELLPEVATKSYNELTQQEQGLNDNTSTNDSPDYSNNVSPAIIHHGGGKLAIGPEVSDMVHNPEEKAPEFTSKKKQVARDALTLNPGGDLNKNEDAKDNEEVPEEDGKVDEPVPDLKNDIDGSSKASKPVKEEPEEKAADNKGVLGNPKDSLEDQTVRPVSGELFANNLVNDTEPKGYESDMKTDVPSILDTEEYHVELHDWSQLERKKSSPWLVLLLLLAVAGAFAYFLVSGSAVPFL